MIRDSYIEKRRIGRWVSIGLEALCSPKMYKIWYISCASRTCHVDFSWFDSICLSPWEGMSFIHNADNNDLLGTWYPLLCHHGHFVRTSHKQGRCWQALLHLGGRLGWDLAGMIGAIAHPRYMHLSSTVLLRMIPKTLELSCAIFGKTLEFWWENSGMMPSSYYDPWFIHNSEGFVIHSVFRHLVHLGWARTRRLSELRTCLLRCFFLLRDL